MEPQSRGDLKVPRPFDVGEGSTGRLLVDQHCAGFDQLALQTGEFALQLPAFLRLSFKGGKALRKVDI